jgi:TPR repeat protein
LRLTLVAAGVAAALAVTTAFEVGVSVESLAGLPVTLLYRLRAPPAGLKPPADPARRLAYYTARAQAGDAAAQVALAVVYAKGEGVRQDYATAASWFRRAAEQGVARAQYDLGVLYERGRGVPIDYAQAALWYRKAARQNHPLAEYNLAVAYTKGEGVDHSLSDAAVWYHRAAAHGVVAAMVNLAILYERGDGVEASTADAYAWYRAAAQRGSASAARRADELLRGFSPWEQTRAEAKMASVAASIDDAIGKRSRLTGRAGPTVISDRSEPALESGIDGRRATASGAARGSP